MLSNLAKQSLRIQIDRLNLIILCREVLTNLGVFQGLVDPSLMFPVRGIVVVFDAVVWATGEFFGDVCPLVAQGLVQIKDELLLCFVNWVFFNEGVEVIVPSKLVWFSLDNKTNIV
jgi:hypothetical protein